MSERTRAKKIQIASGSKRWTYQRALHELRDSKPDIRAFMTEFRGQHKFSWDAAEAWVLLGDPAGLPEALQLEILGIVVPKE